MIFNAAKHRYEAQIRAARWLEDADKFMHQALLPLVDARHHSTMDMFGGGALTDMMKRDALNKAQNATDRVHMLVAQT